MHFFYLKRALSLAESEVEIQKTEKRPTFGDLTTPAAIKKKEYIFGGPSSNKKYKEIAFYFLLARPTLNPRKTFNQQQKPLLY